MQHTCTEDGKAVCTIDCRTTLFVESQLHAKQCICMLGSIQSLVNPMQEKMLFPLQMSEMKLREVWRACWEAICTDRGLWFQSSEFRACLLASLHPPSLGHGYLPQVWAPRVVCAPLGFTLSPCLSLLRFLLLWRHWIDRFVILITKEDFVAHICFSF